MMSAVERGLMRASSMTTSPRLSTKRESTPPSVVSDPALLHIHDRLHQLDAKVIELRSSILTPDEYVDRRNRQDEFIRREFDGQRQVCSRIELNVGRTKSDVTQLKDGLTQLKSEMLQLRTHVTQLGSKEAFLQSDITQLQSDVNQLQLDVQKLHADVCATRTDLSQIQSIVSQLRIDLMTLRRETSQNFGLVFSRFSAMESRMKHMERTRFNSLAQTIHAPITPVPLVEDDGSVRWPEYFPPTVWKFWCLKKRNRVHRLVELADFYELEGYQYWGRMPHAHDATFATDGNMSDSSDSSDLPSDLTRAEAAREYPEACHQALAATLGLVYYKIRNEVGEGPLGHHVPAAHKRLQDEVGSINSSSRQKPAKLSRRSNESSPTNLRIHTGAALDAKSIVSEGLDKLGWNVHASQMSDDTMSKLKGIVSDEVNTILLHALERGRIRLKPNAFERHQQSPTNSSRLSIRARPNFDEFAAPHDDDMATIANTIPTEIISPRSSGEDGRWIPGKMSETPSP
ncbi:hypothetical protein, variant 2 [Blastomyces dermatitidis ER-3]|uniref:Uncharacterized protein n=2 Tax=Blastomyces TaxID=229219 RepID=A0A179UWC3_BLAGS|nr:uncharacterized protein BDBG_06511 [Blastomyces gilchristii SLH14081]XP_045281539.1 uncharacterized protein BDCG_06107 [Blastomyces dermatitidis ER-3]XP_045281540.1 hypothetical protein, variant 1 [Blastomyces dermatitidis ER-3]XP_045281541.1 hypothetical protein, variant 2 [Blastomyces dermatitidis ER-3]OAT01812.1 hypothetical protein BDCG_06107 [Blastomyces dermatitidis ER-3]OAT01813.1 hypothetical protein, variant 1 [Blastomyces dermatitidis ER-3]OAT01814.1 hypothetical protein, variant